MLLPVAGGQKHLSHILTLPLRQPGVTLLLQAAKKANPAIQRSQAASGDRRQACEVALQRTCRPVTRVLEGFPRPLV